MTTVLKNLTAKWKFDPINLEKFHPVEGNINLDVVQTEPTPFTLTSSNISEIGYTDTTTDLVIPETFIGTDGVLYKVTSIDNQTFHSDTNLISISIPDTVTSIGAGAFVGCTNLKTATISNNVTNIGSMAFGNCTNLTSVNIPNSMTILNNSIFMNCSSLTNIIIPDSVTTIYGYAFEKCIKLSSITIPNSVTSIGNYTFDGCIALNTVNYTGTEEEWNAIEIDITGNDSLLNATKVYNYGS